MQDFHGKSSIWREDDFFHQQIKLTFTEETSKVLHFENRSEISWNFWNVVLEKNGEQLEWPCEKWWSMTQSQRG